MKESNEHREDSAGTSVVDGALKLSDKIPWIVAVRAEWLEKGVLVVPPGLAEHMSGTNTVHILYDEVEELLPYEESVSVIEGYSDFYSAQDIAEGDKLCLQLRGLEPTRLLVCRSW